MSRTRVLVVDDHPFFRTGLALWLNRQPGLVCCGEAATAAETRSAIKAQQPEVVLLDLRLGNEDGLELIPELIQLHAPVRIIVLSQFDEQTHAHRALRAGARGYLMKSEATDRVLDAIQTVRRGGVYVSRSMAARLMQNLFPDPASAAPELARLSDRELKVFQLLGAGHSTREVAAQLKISPKTVETYREHLKQKLRLPDGYALLRAATLWVEQGRWDPPGGKDAAQNRPTDARALLPCA
jgi:DNA-binding NarL/FixJ family response regulator